MPFTPVNFLHAPKQESVYGDLLKNAMEGYELARKPKQIAQEEQQRELANRLRYEQGIGAQHENYAKSLRNEYLPHELENKQKTSDINLEFLRGEKEDASRQRAADLASRLLLNQQQEMANQVQEQFGLSNAEIEQATKRAQLNKAKEEANWVAQLRQSEIDKNRALAEKARNPALAGGKVPKTAEELGREAFAKGLGAAQAKQYTEAEDRLVKSGAFKETADRLDEMTRDPSFSAAVGPVDTWTADLFGFPKTREFAKELENTLSQAKLDMLSVFKGSTSDKELKFIEKAAATRGNTESAVRGYINSIKNLSDIGYKRNRLIAQQLSEGVPHYKALENAQKAYPIPDRAQLEKNRGAKSGIDKNGKHHDNIDPTNIKAFIAAGGTLDE